jgi:predicted DNA-binding transcriptional regulator YafY
MPVRGNNAPSAVYRMIRQAVHERRNIVFSYQGLRREACPLILGYAADGKEVVFAYQIGGRTSGGKKLPDWRCFSLAKISALAARDGEWREGESHKQAQSCVRFVDVDVNVPETLTRPQPLPFGSADLRPPRKKP